jgi:hypothetical protein
MKRALLLIVLLAGCALAAAGAAAQEDREEPPGPASLGLGTELVYMNCYEHVGAFRVPLSVIRDLVASDLPAGFEYQTFDPARTIGQLNVVGLDCDQVGHRVTDLLVNAVGDRAVRFQRRAADAVARPHVHRQPAVESPSWTVLLRKRRNAGGCRRLRRDRSEYGGTPRPRLRQRRQWLGRPQNDGAAAGRRDPGGHPPALHGREWGGTRPDRVG